LTNSSSFVLMHDLLTSASGRGPTRAVLTRTAVRSSMNPFVPCFAGIHRLKSA
jgi:hypothetical protein